MRAALALASAFVLASCGGGGGGGGDAGTVFVNVQSGNPAMLLRPSVVKPVITGLEGRSTNCSLKSGTLPPGMRLQSDCSVVGTPTEAGNFAIVVSLGAQGVANQLDWNLSVMVVGPSVAYSVPTSTGAGTAVSWTTLNEFWIPAAGETVTYSVTGNLPAGLGIDATTGRIQGTPTAVGSFTFQVQALLVTPAGTATMRQAAATTLDVYAPTIPYSRSHAWAGLPFTSTPTLPAGGATYTFSAPALPPGLSLDPTTGVLSGTATQPAAATDYPITVTSAGFATTTTLSFVVESPVYLVYMLAPGQVGAPYTGNAVRIWDNSTGTPAMHDITTIGAALPGIGLQFALDPATPLHAGLTIDPATGVVSGTTAIAGSRQATVNVTVTLNGASFVLPVELSVQMN